MYQRLARDPKRLDQNAKKVKQQIADQVNILVDQMQVESLNRYKLKQDLNNLMRLRVSELVTKAKIFKTSFSPL